MSSGGVVIRPCRRELLPQLVELWKEYVVDQNEESPLLPYFDLEASTEGFRNILKSHIEKEPGGFLVATLGGEAVGFCLSFKEAFGPNYVTRERVGHIQVVHTKRGFRRRGIATKLVNTAIEYLRENGCSRVLAETGETNTKSIKMLEKLDFKRLGKIVNFMREI